MILRDLLNDIDIVNFNGDDGLEVSGISIDSNNVKDGFLFVALRGENTDGHRYIDSAVKNGAKALIVEKTPEINSQEVSVVQVNDSRAVLAAASANFFRHPTKELTLVGITGTNGKTTITYLLESIWNHEQRKSGIIGTIDYRYGENIKQSSMTTPESLDLMRMFREMRELGVETVAMEVSSHAIDKDRALQCQFDAAVFTNLTQDHLDYHDTMEDYFQVKKRLFSEYLANSKKEKKYSIINIDDPFGARLVKEISGNLVSYSIKNVNSTVYAKTSRITEEGIEANINSPIGDIQINSTLFGEHNLSNILAAVATAVSLGSSKESIERGISNIKSVPGRLEGIENKGGFNVLVDYAHTPDALKNVLQASRPLTKGRLILVFGCGGDRDNAKRPLMGKIGMELSDVLIITSDNPRTEDPEIILDHIEQGVNQASEKEKSYHRIADRTQAIRKAIKTAKKDDTILIAGKGHEDYQIIGTTKHPFDDREIAREALKEI
ncbi:MAG: UDP-N-acetylmuramoyl-L-alanyl-D-glutamate--2,6-diaminopimelate ligase [Thermodesulfobacteriota bacterium]|nr:MAG: UDP-N-acetylmuramoyl-L-alanyl-D-glutamate--2,6-diaminopimelate ligase [Thermodesulfobacteriota bacterium]